MINRLEPLVGAPVRLKLLRHENGQRSTYRALGSRRSAIVKVFEPGRAMDVAQRYSSLADGPFEPRIPEILAATDDMVVLSDLPGRPLRAALLAGDGDACTRVGTVLGFWHLFWRDRIPDVLESHSLEQELEILRRGAELEDDTIAHAVGFALKAVEGDEEWHAATVVHRDLHEEHVLLDHDIGLIDLDNAAIGPPELDVGNLCAHVELLARRYGRDLDAMQHAFLDGYLSSGAPLELQLVLTCRSLSLLRLASIHRDAELANAYPGSAWPPPPDVASTG